MKTLSKTTFWILYHVGVLLFSLLSAMAIKYSQTGNALVPETVLATFTLFVFIALTGYLAIFIVNRGNKMSHQEINKKIVPAFVAFLVAVFLIANLTITFFVFIWYLIRGMDLQLFMHNLFAYELSYANRSLFVWLVVFTIMFFFMLWRKSAQKEQSLREENLRFRYQTLKAQVNPHFLFNSLNTLSALIYDDIGKADSYIQQMAKVYRYILDHEDTDLVPLPDELAFVKQYFGLQQERMQRKARLNIRIDDAGKYKIIPVSLQLLVENALKHNAYSDESPLQIDISMHDGQIIVSNNIQKKGIVEPTHGIGLSNLRERVNLVTGKELSVASKDNHFVVHLPVIPA